MTSLGAGWINFPDRRTGRSDGYPWEVAGLLFLFTLLVRLPYFVYSVLDWDESTFILMGEDLIAGHLPYVHLWDNKPPLAFYPYALFLLIFGKSVLSVRLAGLVCVFISAFLLYRIGKTVYSESVGICIALVQVLFTSLPLYAGSSTLTEHLILIPLTFSLHIFLLKPLSYKNSLLLGLLSGYMILTRTNMAYFSVALGSVLLLSEVKRNPKTSLTRFLCFGLGNLLLIIPVCLVYLAADQFPLLLRSSVTAPLAYTSAAADELSAELGSFVTMIISGFWFPAGLLLLLLATLGWVLTWSRPEAFAAVPAAKLRVLGVLLAAVWVSIFATGRYPKHYLIQTFPLLLLIGGATLSFFRERAFQKALMPVLLLSLLPALTPAVEAWREIGENLLAGRRIFSDTGYRVARYLNRQGVSGEYVYFSAYHIGYFLTEASIPTPYVHPSNVARDGLIKAVEGDHATSEGTLRDILDTEPVFIVRKAKIDYFDAQCNGCGALLENELDRNYRLERRIDDAYIYKRRPNYPPPSNNRWKGRLSLR